jgi:hypothetical protein
MKQFNKYAALSKLENKNNNKTKRITIVISVIVLVFVILYFSFAKFESTQTYSLIDANVGRFGKKLTDFLLSLDSTDLAYDGIEVLGEVGTEDNNLRYVGQNPNNYIYFNCTTTNPDEMNTSTCEKWRIVGLFNNVEDENGVNDSRIKIIDGNGYSGYSWDTNVSTINAGYGINQWGESEYEDGTPYEGADLMRELNNDYLGNVTVGTDGYWYSSQNNEKNVSPLSNTINENTQQMIETVKWYTGYIPSTSSETAAYKIYYNERHSTGEQNCEYANYCNDTVKRTTTWVGKIALINFSDYLYATSGERGSDRISCLGFTIIDYSEHNTYNNCDIYNWIKSANSSTSSTITLTPYNGSGSGIFGRYTSGNYVRLASNTSSKTYSIRPTLYLKNNVFILGGDGTINNPYKIGI